MASQSLYRKWRSQTFNDLVGQEPIIETLKNALRSGNFSHAYLFTGPRGTGKTSTARLLAKTINCLNPKDGEPCNECQQCREITAGNSFNVIEIDAASNRGIDSIRDLREKVMMPPSTGKYKVYVLDEAHMLTTEAFNALLKTLEEPPGYAVFVLATTEVHKMLPTVLSRCQRFDFKRITTRQIVKHLNFVAEQEHVTLESGAAELLARAAAGGMRDALSLLDQAIAYAGNEIVLSRVQAMLGVADPRAIQKFISHVAQLDTSGGLRLIHELSEAGADLRQINIQIIEYWRGLMLARAGADVATILDRTEDEIREIMEMVQPFALEELTECARVFAQNDLIQRNQGTPQLALELAFLACVELHRRAQSGLPISAAPAMQPRPAAAHPVQPLAVQSAQPVRPQPPATPSQPISRPLPAPATKPQPTKAPEESAESVHEYELSDRPADVREEPEPPTARQETFAPVPADSTPVSSQSSQMFVELEQPVQAETSSPGPTLQQVKERWKVVKQRVMQKNKQTAAMLNHYAVVGVESTGEEMVVMIQAITEVFYNMLNQNDRPKDVEWGLSMEFQRKCRVRLLHSDEAVPTPPSRPANPGNNGGGAAVSTPPPRPQPQSAPVEAPVVPTAPVAPVAPASPSKKKPAEDANGQKRMAQTSDEGHTPMVPLARKNIVRENSNAVSAAAAQEMLEQKAKNHPVVQEIMRTFTVKNVQVNPK